VSKRRRCVFCDDKLASQLVNDAHPSACVQKLSVVADVEEAAETDGVEGKQQEEEKQQEQDGDDYDAGSQCKDNEADKDIINNDDDSDSGVCSVLHDDVSRSPQPQAYSHSSEDVFLVNSRSSHDLDHSNYLRGGEVLPDTDTEAQLDFDADMRILVQLLETKNRLACISSSSSTLNRGSVPETLTERSSVGQQLSLPSDSSSTYHRLRGNGSAGGTRHGSSDLESTRSYTDMHSTSLLNNNSSELLSRSSSVLATNCSSEPVQRCHGDTRDKLAASFSHHTMPSSQLLPGIDMLNSVRGTFRFMRERGILPASSPRLGKSRGKLSISGFKKDNAYKTAEAALAVGATRLAYYFIFIIFKLRFSRSHDSTMHTVK
jgi:hypothetical protein